MPEFGIYFGTEIINITGVQGKKALVNISIPRERITDSASQQKDFDEKKIVSALRTEFRENKISPSNISVTLAGEDLIVRTFDLPIFLSKKELEYPAITFEAKKYIPFKIEDLVFDFRLHRDRKDKKIWVLFVAIKKKILDKYLSIFKQLQIEVRLVEYAGFSILRLLRIGGSKDTGVLGLLNVDLEEETNFLVCQNGFPLFSRDIILSPKSEAESKLDLMEKLKNEIRISLDFFQRKFPTKPIDRAVILSLPQVKTEIDALIKDLDLSTAPLEISNFLGREFELSSALVKSYSTAISNIQRLRFPVNLLRPVIKKEAELPTQALPIVITTLKINHKVALLAFLILFLSVGWGWLKQVPLQSELKIIRENQPRIKGISGEQNLKVISGLEKELTNKINIMDNLVKNRLYLTEVMDTIPRLMPKGAWLTSFSFNALKDKLEFSLEGTVFLNDSDKEFAAVNDIVLGLKNEPKFSQRFKEMNVVSMERTTLAELQVTEFAILCR